VLCDHLNAHTFVVFRKPLDVDVRQHVTRCCQLLFLELLLSKMAPGKTFWLGAVFTQDAGASRVGRTAAGVTSQIKFRVPTEYLC